MKQDELYKNRSISACLKTAYVLWSTNFTIICKRVWKPLLALSLSSVVAVEAALTVYKSAMMGQWSVGGGIALLLGLVLLLASSMWYLAAVMTLATPLGLRKCLRRSAAALGFLTGSFIVLSLLLMAVSVGFFLLASKKMSPITEATWNTGIQAVIFLVYLVLMLPFAYSLMNYFNQPDTRFVAGFLKPWSRGMRHWGRLFSVMFFSGLILFIVEAVVEMPLYLLLKAAMMSADGVAGGDASGLPGSFPVLLAVTALIVYALIYLVTVWNIFTLHYAYGSMVATDREKKALKSEQENQ